MLAQKIQEQRKFGDSLSGNGKAKASNRSEKEKHWRGACAVVGSTPSLISEKVQVISIVLKEKTRKKKKQNAHNENERTGQGVHKS